MSEFYVGYLPKSPERLGRLLLRVIIGLNFVAVAVALLLVFGQAPFASSTFEFLQYRDYQGVLVNAPYPTLLTSSGEYLLVAPGKHGVADLVPSLNPATVKLSGSLIRRGGDRMLEVAPGSIRLIGAASSAAGVVDLGPATLTGEIVDSKCYYGVMNPGNGKVHRACAVRCISGGIPPAFAVKDAAGSTRTLLLSGVERNEILDMVAEPVTIRGRIQGMGQKLILVADRRGNKAAIERH